VDTQPAHLLNLAGRTILVTGASSGIGRSIAQVLSSLGARIVASGRDCDRLASTVSSLCGDGHKAAPFDLSDAAAVPPWVRGIAADNGPLHGIVHSAGAQMTASVRFTDLAQAEGLFRTNVLSAIALARGFCQKGCSAAGGGIVFISSVMGLVGKPGLGVYSATKAALSGLARSLAVELAPAVRVNCIAPAFVEGEMLARLREELPAQHFDAIAAAHPLGFGTPADVANATAFLLADTGRWITGSTLVVDGGYSAQ
jgi:NAD(P)-dependent dehydrogenase (short-subunit alcohol dehydrogenase family)